MPVHITDIKPTTSYTSSTSILPTITIQSIPTYAAPNVYSANHFFTAVRFMGEFTYLGTTIQDDI
jgi:hypothetical protein